jgi:hypothetical protein
MNIMKTKIRTLLAICVLGFIGLININAIADNKKVVNADVVAEKVQMLTNEKSTSNDASLKSAEEYTTSGTDARMEKLASIQILLMESENATSDLLKEAELFTKWVVDQEEAKLVQKLNAKSDELIEAELFTKWVVDQEEAKLVQKLNAKSDELIEAELFTKWVVDQEEAKLVQKLIPQVEAQDRE